MSAREWVVLVVWVALVAPFAAWLLDELAERLLERMRGST